MSGTPPYPPRTPDAGAPGAELMDGVETILGADPEAMVSQLLELGRDLCLRLFEGMAGLRAFDERAVILQRQGRIGTYPTFYGEEAVQTASVVALEERDWLFPTYRQTAVVTLRGCPPLVPLLMWRGHPGGWHDVMRYRVAPVCVPVATNLPHAVGAAWGARLRSADWVALGYAGDGATSAGDFHEACNLAAVTGSPVIFLVNNNQWAISTPLRRQTRVQRLAEKAAAYGMPGLRVDAFDVFACHRVLRRAAELARSGGGPTLVEAVGYRLGPHGTADEPALYRSPAADRLWAPMEPLGRAQLGLVSAGLADAGELAEIRGRASARLLAAAEELERSPRVTLEEIADTVHLSTPWDLSPDHLREPSWAAAGE